MSADAGTAVPAWPPREPDGHKGTFGTVCVVGGQAAAPRVMLGGPAFSADAALRVGAGLAVLAVPAPLMTAALTVAPSATGLALPVDGRDELVPSEVAAVLDAHAGGVTCLAIGPGLGAGRSQQQIAVRVVAHAEVPLVIDADAINALAAVPSFDSDFRASAVLTPHPGEYRRLAEALALDVDPVDPDGRVEQAETLARRLGCVVVLKGAGTVVTDGLESWVNPTGNAALATAGTGDVLTGVIAGLVAQFADRAGRPGRLSLAACARLGVYVHGLAADRWAARHGNAGLLAKDLLAELPDAVQAMRQESRADAATTTRGR
ncbi:MAG: NAD(P)H-hydrate dehydratase [Planctomycetota bacterium]